MPLYTASNYEVTKFPVVALNLRDVTMSKATPATEFKLFSKLPYELRAIIWHIAASERRIITIYQDPDCSLTAKHSALTVPNVLHISQEARDIGLKHYQLRFCSSFGHNPIYFSFTQDALFFPGFYEMYSFYGCTGRGWTSTPIPADILEMESKLKMVIVGNTRHTICNSMVARWWRVEEFLVEEPFDLNCARNLQKRALREIREKWKAASDGVRTPKVRILKAEDLEAMQKVENVIFLDSSVFELG
jgi:hypothetical protein